MQVRILQMRDFDPKHSGSGLSRAMQTASTTVFGGTYHGTDPSGDYARDRAKLEAQNALLARQGCPTFDLDRELSSGNGSVLPTPRRNPS